jgi:hypothetical protein
MTREAEMAAKYARWAEQDRWMQKLGRIAFWAGVAVLALTFWAAYDNEVSMAKCQKAQSFDTCYHSLHR